MKSFQTCALMERLYSEGAGPSSSVGFAAMGDAHDHYQQSAFVNFVNDPMVANA